MRTWEIHGQCTGCDVARQLAPELIATDKDGRSIMIRQPVTEAEQRAMNAAAYACHVGAVQPTDGPLDPADDPYPIRLDDKVYFCGHNSPANVAAGSYLLRRPEGNVMMVDTPLFSHGLAERYSVLGPVTDVLLTHRDHAQHGERYAAHFGARLWIHEGDLDAAPTADQVMRGREPIEIAEGVIAHPLIGHTEGNVVFVADDTYCFSGDSFYWSRTTQDIEVFDTVTWYSIREFAASLQRAVPRLKFEWLLPGHGSRAHLPAEEMAGRMRSLASRTVDLIPRAIDFTAVRY